MIGSTYSIEHTDKGILFKRDNVLNAFILSNGTINTGGGHITTTSLNASNFTLSNNGSTLVLSESTLSLNGSTGMNGQMLGVSNNSLSWVSRELSLTKVLEQGSTATNQSIELNDLCGNILHLDSGKIQIGSTSTYSTLGSTQLVIGTTGLQGTFSTGGIYLECQGTKPTSFAIRTDMNRIELNGDPGTYGSVLTSGGTGPMTWSPVITPTLDQIISGGPSSIPLVVGTTSITTIQPGSILLSDIVGETTILHSPNGDTLIAEVYNRRYSTLSRTSLTFQNSTYADNAITSPSFAIYTPTLTIPGNARIEIGDTQPSYMTNHELRIGENTGVYVNAITPQLSIFSETQGLTLSVGDSISLTSSSPLQVMNEIQVYSTLMDGTTTGTSGQYLSSTGSGVQWTTPTSLGTFPTIFTVGTGMTLQTDHAIEMNATTMTITASQVSLNAGVSVNSLSTQTITSTDTLNLVPQNYIKMGATVDLSGNILQSNGGILLGSTLDMNGCILTSSNGNVVVGTTLHASSIVSTTILTQGITSSDHLLLYAASSKSVKMGSTLDMSGNVLTSSGNLVLGTTLNAGAFGITTSGTITAATMTATNTTSTNAVSAPGITSSDHLLLYAASSKSVKMGSTLDMSGNVLTSSSGNILIGCTLVLNGKNIYDGTTTGESGQVLTSTSTGVAWNTITSSGSSTLANVLAQSPIGNVNQMITLSTNTVGYYAGGLTLKLNNGGNLTINGQYTTTMNQNYDQVEMGPNSIISMNVNTIGTSTNMYTKLDYNGINVVDRISGYTTLLSNGMLSINLGPGVYTQFKNTGITSTEAFTLQGGGSGILIRSNMNMFNNTLTSSTGKILLGATLDASTYGVSTTGPLNSSSITTNTMTSTDNLILSAASSKSVKMGSTLDMSGNVLTSSGNLLLGTTLNAGAFGITTSGTITAATMTATSIASGSLTTGTISSTDTLTLSASTQKSILLGSTLDLSGNILKSSTGRIVLGSTLDTNGYTITSSGYLNLSATNSISMGSAINMNYNNIVSGGSLTFGSAPNTVTLTSSGITSVSGLNVISTTGNVYIGGTLDLSGNILRSNNGSVIVGCTLDLGGNAIVSTGGTIYMGSALDLVGNSLRSASGTINIGNAVNFYGNKLTSSATPVDSTDIPNKQYIDSSPIRGVYLSTGNTTYTTAGNIGSFSLSYTSQANPLFSASIGATSYAPLISFTGSVSPYVMRTGIACLSFSYTTGTTTGVTCTMVVNTGTVYSAAQGIAGSTTSATAFLYAPITSSSYIRGGVTLNLGLISTASNTFSILSSPTPTLYFKQDEIVYPSITPVGNIIAYGGIACPLGYLWCDGASYTVITGTTQWHLNDLFNVIQYTYGGSGSVFNVPNLRGRFPVGSILTYPLRSVETGNVTVYGGSSTLVASQVPGHTHPVNVTSTLGITGNISGLQTVDNNKYGGGSKDGLNTATFTALSNTLTISGGVSATTTTNNATTTAFYPTHTAFNYIIKY